MEHLFQSQKVVRDFFKWEFYNFKHYYEKMHEGAFFIGQVINLMFNF